MVECRSKIEEILVDYEGVMNSFVDVLSQRISITGYVYETILVKLWINKDIFEAANVVRKLFDEKILFELIEDSHDKYSTIKYKIYYV